MTMTAEKSASAGHQHAASDPLAQLGAALDVLSAITGNPKMHIQQARLFVHVAACGEVLQGELDTIAGIAQSSASRNVALLGNGVKPDEPGYGLVESEEVPHYRRAKVVRLTERGKALAWDMQQAIVGSNARPVRPPNPSSPS